MNRNSDSSGKKSSDSNRGFSWKGLLKKTKKAIENNFKAEESKNSTPL